MPEREVKLYIGLHLLFIIGGTYVCICGMQKYKMASVNFSKSSTDGDLDNVLWQLLLWT